MLTIEKQIQLIKEAKQQKATTLELLSKSNIIYEKDSEDYKNILNAKTLTSSIAIYNSLDTAARDKLMEILTNTKF